MSIITAIAHIVGSIIALFAFGAGVLALGAWESKHNRKAYADELSIALGIPAERLDDREHAPKVVQYAAARYSSDLFRNRLSDLCGWVRNVWGWAGNLLQIGLLIGVIWYTVTDDPANAVNAWWVIAIAFFFWIASVAFALLCKLFTGRYPGQAREARKMLAEYVRTQHAAPKEEDDDDDDDDYFYDEDDEHEEEESKEKPAG